MTKVNVLEMRNVEGGASVTYECPNCKKTLTWTSNSRLLGSVIVYAKLAWHQGTCKKK